MRSRLHFEVHGSNLVELKRRALQVVAELLQESDVSEVESKVDIEMEIKVNYVDKTGDDSVESFTSDVWAKFR